MNEIQYVGENLLLGKIGNFFVILATVAALLSCISYYFASSEKSNSDSWKTIARTSFWFHALAVIGIVVTLFYMLMNHHFEYEYVWHHSNKAMRKRYILSCFWEGQEGSFLLWTFWHVVLGAILRFTSKKWEAPVMTTVMAVQVFLGSMLLGIYVFDYKIGSNPFTIILREHPDFANIPIFSKIITDEAGNRFCYYLQKFDGRGLNPLLQNYWMTIHPPTLFLGFALTLIPFAYAIAGLWKKKFNEWQQFALPWTFAGIMILGTGILMGGAWAYEALSFGGFWAWDPVENASLVPWLTLVGAGHVMLINKNKHRSLFSTFLLPILTFILILYSTFLTRSGILGETSVHAFTDLGMTGQLLIYLFFFIALSSILLIINFKVFKSGNEEEALWSREFWMFVGSLVLLTSSFHIMFNTSMPVWNKLFDMTKATPKADFYNSWQVPFAVIITFLIGFTQFLKYKDTNFKEFIKKISLALFASGACTLVLAFALQMNEFIYLTLLYSSSFCVIANADYWLRILKGKIKNAGPSVAHIGFGLVLMGALISTSKQKIISQNSSDKNIETLSKDFSNNRNILMEKGDTLAMGEYHVVYKGYYKEGINIYFPVDYLKKMPDGTFALQFTLNPLIQMNERMGNSAEPDTRHFLRKDIYTHVNYFPMELLEAAKKKENEYTDPEKYTIKIGDTITTSTCLIVIDGLNKDVNKKKYNLSDSILAVEANLRVLDMNSKTYNVSPVFVIRNNRIEAIEQSVDALGLKVVFNEINPDDGKIGITVQERKSNQKDFIVMEAIIFPGINILWTGCLIMIIGTLIAICNRSLTPPDSYRDLSKREGA